MVASGQRSDRSELGAALILAMVFILGVGAVLVPLLSLTGSNMISTSNLQVERNLEFAADAVMEGAIESIRHDAPTTSCPTFPAGSSTGLTVDGTAMEVQCSEAPMSVLNPNGRYVEFDACVSKSGETWNTCQSTAVIRAQVSFCDLATGCDGSSSPSGVDYGNEMSVWNWVVRKANA